MQVYLGLGSNLGDREGNLMMGIEYLSKKVVIEQVSSLYETEPVGYLDQPWFLNAVISGSTEFVPWELLHFIKEVEYDIGRAPSFPNGPRSIDIDILLYANRVIQTTELTIPHPRLAERAFVLVPLAAIAPGLVHPTSQKAIRDLLAGLEGLTKVVRRQWKGRQYV